MLRRLLQSSFRTLSSPQSTGALMERVASSSLCSTSGAQILAEAAGPWQTFLSRAASTARSDGMKAYKPTTSSLRGRIITSRKDLWKGGPFKPLTEGLRKSGGRNNQGRITIRHRGGGHRKVYRLVDFKRAATTPAGVVERIEYDPNRSARIALVKHPEVSETAKKSDQYSYMLAPQGILPGDAVHCGADAPIKPGSSLPLSAIPVGMQIHNVELRPGAGGQLSRAAGTYCTLIKKGDDGYAVVRLPSGEQRLVLLNCMATVGVLSNPQHKNRKLGKAGARRWSGRRPTVRGVAMNTVDHPHGGGRGKSKGRISQTPWGMPTKGFRTRKKSRPSWAIWVSRHKAKR